MEYMEAGSLSSILKETGPLSEPSIRYVMRELLRALVYLHTERKIHRDIKVSEMKLLGMMMSPCMHQVLQIQRITCILYIRIYRAPFVHPYSHESLLPRRATSS
jgi:serine/threonine protein kinase